MCLHGYSSPIINLTAWRLRRCYLGVIPNSGLWMHGLRQSGSRSGSHPDPPEYIATYQPQGEGVTREDLSRKHWTTLNRLRSNWCRSLQIIYGEVWTDGLCSMSVWRARTDSSSRDQHIPCTWTTIRSRPLRS